MRDQAWFILLALLFACAAHTQTPFEGISPTQIGVATTSRIGIERRVLCDQESNCFRGSHGEADMAALVTHLHGRPIDLNSAYSCGASDPTSCRLNEVDDLLAFGTPRVQGDTARVWFERWSASSSQRQPVARARSQAIFAFRDGRWAFIRVDEDGAS